MKRFLSRVIIFSTICLIAIILVLRAADGRTDPYYIRFTTPKQSCLILGTSRAAQGIQPSVLNKIMREAGLPYNFFNYSFTVGNSPFGETYYRSIQRKLDTSKKHECFIVAVDPWSISSNTVDPNDSVHFQENFLQLAKVHNVNTSPNYEYLVKAYEGQKINILRAKFQNNEMFLHNDGWLEVTPPKIDSATFQNNIHEKMKSYRIENLPYYKFSIVRFNYLVKTLQFLRNYGKVYLVRLPVVNEMENMEDILMSDFEERMESLSKTNAIPYLSFRSLPNHYIYTDGNHLYKESGKKVSEIIGNWIKSDETTASVRPIDYGLLSKNSLKK